MSDYLMDVIRDLGKALRAERARADEAEATVAQRSNEAEKRTVEAYINLVLHKTGLDPNNVASIELNAGFEAVVTVYPTNANGAKVINKETGQIDYERVTVPIAWDNQKLIGKVMK